MISEKLARLDGLDDVVNMLDTYGQSLVFHKDKINGNSALHIAKDADIARELVHTISHSERNNLLTALNDIDQSPLHSAVQIGRADVVNYLLFHDIVVDKLLEAKDWYGNTPLHYVQDVDSATSIIRAALECGLDVKGLITAENIKGKTPVHAASEDYKADVVSYLLSHIKTRDLRSILEKTCPDGNTAVHLVKDVATMECLLDSYIKTNIEQQNEASFLNLKNNLGQTAMHTASYMQDSPCLVEKIIEIMEYAYKDENENHYLLSLDTRENTALLLAISNGKKDIADCILKHSPSAILNQLLSHRNSDDQNAYHIASKQVMSCAFLELLMEYTDEVNNCEIMKPDHHGNSPLHYLAGSYKVEPFSRHILKLPLPRRRLAVYSSNATNTDCRRMIAEKAKCTPQELNEYFRRSVLNDDMERSLYSFYGDMISTWQWLLIRKSFNLTYDHRLKKAMCYALLEYYTEDECVKANAFFRIPSHVELQIARDVILVSIVQYYNEHVIT